MVLGFCCCEQGPGKDRVFRVFNEGVLLNLQADAAQERGDTDTAFALNRRSIEKFREVLTLDAAHPVVRSALAHSLYGDRQYEEAISWFEKANEQNGPSAANYREMGLCRINKGRIPDGRNDIDKAFALDTSKEIRDITVQDLADIGQLAFRYGEGYEQQGDAATGKGYKEFAVGVLLLAYSYDGSRRDIAAAIASFAGKLGDQALAAKYSALSR